jgi:tRNA A-37 threonylcarbamoyl transferase component Bud32
MNMEVFKKYVSDILKNNQDEIFLFEYENKKYWLKKARATESTVSHKIYYKFFPFEILLPVEKKSPQESLSFETNKIEHFKTLGIKTPNIVLKTDEYFILEDCGKMVNSYIRRRDITQERMRYFVDKLIDTLVTIHSNNEYHGGAQARNFIYKDGEVFVIDLEDSFGTDIDLKLLQFRDLMLLLLSFTKTRSSFEFDYKYVIERYIEKSYNYDFKKRLITFGNKFSWLIRLSEINILNKMLGRDVKGFFKLLKSLKSL